MAESPVKAYQALIRAAKLRATPSRVAVLRLLSEAHTPLSHAEVADQLDGTGFDRATLYRNLMDMAEAGLLRRSDLGDHAWRFELVSREEQPETEHPHFICGNCGTIECLPDTAVQVKPVRGGPRALKSKDLAVQIRGLCDKCL